MELIKNNKTCTKSVTNDEHSSFNLSNQSLDDSKDTLFSVLPKDIDKNVKSSTESLEFNNIDLMNQNKYNPSILYLKKKKNRKSRKKLKNSSLDCDYEENDIYNNDIDSIARRRNKRVAIQKNYNEYVSTNKIYDDNEGTYDSYNDDNISVPIDTILGIKLSSDPPLYLVRMKNSSNAEAKMMTADQILIHPSGQSQLATFESYASLFGFKQSPSIPFLSVPGNISPPPQKDIDRIITFNRETQLYLVKWVGVTPDNATWEAIVSDQQALLKFQQKQVFHPKIDPIPIIKPYGIGENSLPIYKNGNTLRSYQIEALNWMLFSYFNNKNSILADEMGLGKTVMCIALLNEIVTKLGIRGPFLVIAPLSTLPNWEREISNWTNLDCILFHGSPASKEVIKKYEIFYDPPNQFATKCQIILTNVETVNFEFQFISSIHWHFVIIDEAHRLKNINSKFYQNMFCLRIDHKLLMTGTPIQNNLEEIFALLHFIEPNTFTSIERFQNQYNNCQTAEDVKLLKLALKPYMLRRKKRDVDTNIGSKEETIVEVELTKTQKYYYRLLIDQKSGILTSNKTYVRIRDLHNLAMQLRKVCNHPFLLPKAEDEIVRPGQNPLQVMIESSGKLVFIDKLLSKLKVQNTKVLIFSQMVRVLDILADFLNYRQYQYVRIDGSVTNRQEAIDQFNDPESGVFVFLLCTKAGGVGLNLIAATTVIIYDSDWNPQNDIQAQARCHRIGQTHEVKVYRLITRGTYESEMFERASLKLGLDQAILDTKVDGIKNNISTKEIETLLKKGAYYVYNEDESEIEKFITEDIDEILQRRTKSISHVDTDSSFSKASFIIDKDGDELDVNDKNFWKRLLSNPEMEESEKPISYPRERKTRHSPGFMDISKDETFNVANDLWTPKMRDSLHHSLLLFGYGRWDQIANAIGVLTLDMIIDGSSIILFILSLSLEKPEEHLKYITDRNFKLTTKQRGIMNSDAFCSRKWRNSLHKHADQDVRRLIQLKTLIEWAKNGRKTPDTTCRGKWNNEDDFVLLSLTFMHGWGNWESIFNDPKMGRKKKPSKKFCTSRLIQLIDSLYECHTFHFLQISSDPLPGGNIPKILKILAEIGKNTDMIDDIDGNEICLDTIELLINASKIISTLEPNIPLKFIVNTIERISPNNGAVIAKYLNVEKSKRICRNIKWLQRISDFMKNGIPNLDMIEYIVQTNAHPEWWKSEIHDLFILNYINEKGFYNLGLAVLENENFQKNLTPKEMDYYSFLIERKKKFDFLKAAKGQIGFIFVENRLIEWIENFIHDIGGWNTPKYIDVPEKFQSDIRLPITCSNIIIESIGDGELHMIDNSILFKCKFRSKIYYKNTFYTCKIVTPNEFVIQKGTLKLWRGRTPLEVWGKVDPYFKDNPYETFGFGCDIIQYYYIKTTKSNPFPENYTQPKINFYQTDLIVIPTLTLKSNTRTSRRSNTKSDSDSNDYDFKYE
ncbi:Type III restriction enzyme, res subunit family protein [Tritrichomonas foetus]|uniref:Type III restriction enzyme, res subunit family protein n=1 Tax=Tritrichomonas foetus TaxID=1144522 RepID=A0A1J4KTC0_9EUKA|nr:Type III restriction enzyme, res subunit family protein [Tritrichomonas foetus]|eukprot:OHT14491.1 Type III restriction enzyme, res subunit family protein [Tritrichomonas foetus]